jgi:hypothetical protein
MDVAPEYVEARRVLLDAIDALGIHRRNVILVGAQAVYHHVGAGDLRVAVVTTDGDLALDTRDLADVPDIGASLRAAGFVPGANPGHWIGRGDVAVDIMVVPSQSNVSKPTARAARIPLHDRQTARITPGLEPALVDNAAITIDALDQSDARRFELRVAGPAALLVAKLVKIGERLQHRETRPDRPKEKDALDAFRLLRSITTDDLIKGLRIHLADSEAEPVTTAALGLLRREGRTVTAALPQLAATASLDDPTVAPSFAELVGQLLATLDE